MWLSGIQVIFTGNACLVAITEKCGVGIFNITEIPLIKYVYLKLFECRHLNPNWYISPTITELRTNCLLTEIFDRSKHVSFDLNAELHQKA